MALLLPKDITIDKLPQIWGGVQLGFGAHLMASLSSKNSHTFVFVARDDHRAQDFISFLSFFAPEKSTLYFPPWDVTPYDRLDPKIEVMAARLDVLAQLKLCKQPAPFLVTTVAAMAQKVLPPDILLESTLSLEVGHTMARSDFLTYAAHNGYHRLEVVRAAGEFAVRGDIIDFFPATCVRPVRIDFFGDTIERMRWFDPLTQKSDEEVTGSLTFTPANEVILTPETIQNFKANYCDIFGISSYSDELYESIENGISYPGMAHWLTLFYTQPETLQTYTHKPIYFFDHQVDDVFKSCLDQVQDHYQARVLQLKTKTDMPYRPVVPDLFYMTTKEWMSIPAIRLSPFKSPEDVHQFDSKPIPQFMPEKSTDRTIVYEKIKNFIKTSVGASLLTSATPGGRDRLQHLIEGHVETKLKIVETYQDLKKCEKVPGLTTMDISTGFDTKGLAILSETDLFGDTLKRPQKRRQTHKILTMEMAGFEVGDLLVHLDHGVGRYEGLSTLDTGQGPHDCLRLTYQGDDRLYVPVEHIGVLSKFGSGDEGVLDKLGATTWKKRKAQVEKRLFDIAEKLIAIAAKRALEVGEVLTPSDGLYQEFCDRFPYTETEDQLKALEDIIEDFGQGRPMDRLVCGDVGFGKTEVAMRAAFIAAASGGQVVIVVPTTLLANQHYRTFSDRFRDFPFKVGHLSRMVSQKERTETLKGLVDGTVNIVIGTHAVFAKNVSFHHLSLVIIDEEQHFGVTQKEKLKNMQPGVHVLSLSATPIPRTLQMAMTGIKEMSLISMPPVDRLAVQSFVMPVDDLIIREAILREYYRGGQVYYVCPRLADIEQVHVYLKALVPEVKIAVAHGQLPPAQLEKIMESFAGGAYQILLSTSIVESGLDISTANTLIVHRADMFGLSQLYQLRGRVGRSKARGYAYFTLPPQRQLATKAQKRLEVMQTLEGLGAGFALASHDMDIRGTGNLVGAEQSGHIKEVGLELYQHMLEEAIQTHKMGEAAILPQSWQPQISMAMEVRIPEVYVPDLGLRLGLYRRLADLTDADMIVDFRSELIDRFGPIPQSVENLLKLLILKQLCMPLHIEKINVGDKGAIFTFYKNNFPYPEKLINFLHQHPGVLKLRPDQKLVLSKSWGDVDKQFEGIKSFLENFALAVAS